MKRQVRIWGAVTGALALLGLPMGLVWAWLAERPRYVIVGHHPYPADADSEALIGADGRLAFVCVAVGLITGLTAYWLAGRWHEVPLVLGLVSGGLLGSLLAWWTGHRFGLSGFAETVRTAADGTRVIGPLDLHATAVVTLWPLVAVIAFGVLEALDVAGRLRPSYRGGPGSGEPQKVGGGEFDLQAAPPGGDIDRREF